MDVRAAEAEGRMRDEYGMRHDFVSSSCTSREEGGRALAESLMATREKPLVQLAARWLLRRRPFEPELVDRLRHNADELFIRSESGTA